jgi:hypothetical protein
MTVARPLALLCLATALAAGEAAALPIGDQARVDGEAIHADAIEIGRLALSDASAKPQFANQILTLADCRANAYGGTVTGTITIDLHTNVNRTRCDLKLTGLDLGAVVAELGGSADNLAGRLTASIDISFPNGKVEEAVGHGNLAIKDGNLVELSWLTNLLVGDLSNTRGQDVAEAGFIIGGNDGDGVIRITHATITLPKTRILLSGTVNLAGELRLLVIPHVTGGLLGELWLVGKVIGNVLSFTSSRVARAVVRGHVSKPVVVINPFAE